MKISSTTSTTNLAMANRIRKIITKVYREVRRITARVNRSPVWVLGNQKSGTTAIASLISEYGGLSFTIDFGDRPYKAAEQIVEVAKNQLTAEEFIRNFKWYFSKDLIKEPHLTFVFNQFDPLFPDAKYVFIARDPRDNIRSILDRVALPGNKKDINLDQHPEIIPIWKKILRNEGLNLDGKNYIEKLAYRWCAALDVYLRNRERMYLVTFESFQSQKEETIRNICQKLGIEEQNDISDKLHIQYQPKGNRSVSWEDFFGIDNLEKITAICGSRMEKIGYQTKVNSN